MSERQTVLHTPPYFISSDFLIHSLTHISNHLSIHSLNTDQGSWDSTVNKTQSLPARKLKNEARSARRYREVCT